MLSGSKLNSKPTRQLHHTQYVYRLWDCTRQDKMSQTRMAHLLAFCCWTSSGSKGLQQIGYPCGPESPLHQQSPWHRWTADDAVGVLADDFSTRCHLTLCCNVAKATKQCLVPWWCICRQSDLCRHNQCWCFAMSTHCSKKCFSTKTWHAYNSKTGLLLQPILSCQGQAGTILMWHVCKVFFWDMTACS